MSVSTSISRNDCASAPATTSGCSGTEYAPSQPSQFDVMFQEVQDRMYKLFERYSQLKERNRQVTSSRRSSRENTEPDSRVSTAKSTSKNVSTANTATHEETVEDETGSETSCSCSLRSDMGTRDTDDEPRNIAAGVASKPTRISNEPCATIPRTISPVPQPECSEPFPTKPAQKPNSLPVKTVSPPTLSSSLPVPAVNSRAKSEQNKQKAHGNTDASTNGKIDMSLKNERLSPPSDSDEPVVVPLNNIANEKSRPQSMAGSSVCPQCEDKTCRQHKLPRPPVGYQLNFPPTTRRPKKPAQECGCSYSAQPSGRNHGGGNIMQISRLRSACMCVNQELSDVQQRGQGDGEVCQGTNNDGVWFGECETVPLQDAFYNRKKVFIMRSEDRQEQIQSKRDGRMHPSWWSGPSIAEQTSSPEPAWYQRFDSRSASADYRQNPKAQPQEDGRMGNGCFIDQQKDVPLIYRDNEISLKRARMETSRRVKQLEPKKVDRAQVLENKRVRRQKMMAYSRIVRNRNHYLYERRCCW